MLKLYFQDHSYYLYMNVNNIVGKGGRWNLVVHESSIEKVIKFFNAAQKVDPDITMDTTKGSTELPAIYGRVVHTFQYSHPHLQKIYKRMKKG